MPAPKPHPDEQKLAKNKAATPQDQLKQKQAEAQAVLPLARNEMTPEDARNLLNSLRDEQRHFPVAPLSPRSDNAQEEPPLRDW